MSDPNNSEPLDETLVQPDANPTQAPRADATVDFSSWTWAAKEPTSQTLPLSQSAAPATSKPSSPHTHDETLVHSMLAEKQETRHIEDALDQTLVHHAWTRISPFRRSVDDAVSRPLVRNRRHGLLTVPRTRPKVSKELRETSVSASGTVRRPCHNRATREAGPCRHRGSVGSNAGPRRPGRRGAPADDRRRSGRDTC